MTRTNVYLKRPQLSSAFDVEVVLDDESNGRLEGPDLERVAKLLRVSEGAPVFDLESDGKLLGRCQMKAPESNDSIPFSYDCTTIVEAPKSDPNATYR